MIEMNLIAFLIRSFLLVSLTNAHGSLTNPISRQFGKKWENGQFSGGQFFQYYYRGKF